jgi:hypothetical protein
MTGVDANGRSCLVDVVDVVPGAVEGGHGVNVARMFATTESPPPPRLPALGQHVDVSLAPGMFRWLVVDHPAHDPGAGPTTARTIHHGDTLDLVFIHEGSGNLLLQDGAHPVQAGDCIVMAGVDHAMQPGPEGCRILVVSIGTPPPSPS